MKSLDSRFSYSFNSNSIYPKLKKIQRKTKFIFPLTAKRTHHHRLLSVFTMNIITSNHHFSLDRKQLFVTTQQRKWFSFPNKKKKTPTDQIWWFSRLADSCVSSSRCFSFVFQGMSDRLLTSVSHYVTHFVFFEPDGLLLGATSLKTKKNISIRHDILTKINGQQQKRVLSLYILWPTSSSSCSTSGPFLFLRGKHINRYILESGLFGLKKKERSSCWSSFRVRINIDRC